jgi:hypothetical protein
MHHMALGLGGRGAGFGHVSCLTRSTVYALKMQEGIVQRRDTRDDTPAYKSEEEGSNLNFIGLRSGYSLSNNDIQNKLAYQLIPGLGTCPFRNYQPGQTAVTERSSTNS